MSAYISFAYIATSRQVNHGKLAIPVDLILANYRSCNITILFHFISLLPIAFRVTVGSIIYNFKFVIFV